MQTKKRNRHIRPRCPLCGDRGNIFLHLEDHSFLVCYACDKVIHLHDVQKRHAETGELLAAVERLLHPGQKTAEAVRNGRRLEV